MGEVLSEFARSQLYGDLSAKSPGLLMCWDREILTEGLGQRLLSGAENPPALINVL